MTPRRPAKALHRGQPLIVLALLLAAWIGVRSLTWEAPFALAADSLGSTLQLPAQSSEVPSAQIQDRALAAQDEDAGADRDVAADGVTPPLQMPVMPYHLGDTDGWRAPAIAPAPAGSTLTQPRPGQTDLQGQEISANFTPASRRMSAGHTMLMAAAFSQMEVPAHLQTYFRRPEDREAPTRLAARGPVGVQAAPYVVPFAPEEEGQPRRWSADGWLLWRQDNSSPLLSGRPAYGRSQAGGVVRYELAPSSRNRPQVHLRGSAALQGSREYEAALGASARPLVNVPVRVAAEVRVAERAGGREVRPAAYAVSEFPPLDLPAGLTGELYLQGGYVGGDFATGFVDGQARIEGTVASVQGNGQDSAPDNARGAQFRAGAAVWGGAQRDAKRLDIGPSASVTFNVGDGRGRLAADYRFRVAGNAQPASGPALTLSAGF